MIVRSAVFSAHAIGRTHAGASAWLDTIRGARLIVTHDSGHNIPIEQPQLVVDTIREVVRAAKDRRAR